MAIEAAEAQELRDCLTRYSGWEKIPEETLNSLVQSAQRMDVRRKRSIFRRDEPGPGLFVVRSGEFKLSLISSEGREQILYLAGAGKIIGEGFLPKDIPCAASAFAMVDSQIWRIESDHIVKLAAGCEAMAFALMRHMAFRSNRLIDLVLDLSLRSVQRRLASFLLNLANRTGASSDSSHTIPRELDMNTVAARLGTVREEISRALNRMQRDGILRLSRKEITVLDLSALEAATFE